MLRKIKKIVLWFFGTIISLILVAILLAYIYEDEVKAYAVEKLNQHLNAPIAVEEIELTLLEKFPYASLDFTKVLMHDAWNDSTQQQDTLVYAEHIYLQFNLMDLFGDDYQVKRLTVEDGVVNLRILEDGHDNFHVWKSVNDTSSGSFTFALEDVLLKSTDISYNNKATQQEYTFQNSGISLSGDFAEESFELKGNVNTYVDRFRGGEINYISEKDVNLEVSLKVNTATNTYEINKGSLLVAELPLNIEGNVVVDSTGSKCALAVNGSQLDLATLTSVLPRQYKEKFAGYGCTGNLNFNANIDGLANATTSPQVKASFSINEGALTEDNSGIRLENLALKGNYQNQETDGGEKVALENIQCKLGNGTVGGSLLLENFTNPMLKTQLKGAFNLADVQRFLQIDTVETVSGSMSLAVQFHGQASQLQKFSASDFKQSTTSGSILLNKASLKLKGQPFSWNDITGKLTLKNNDAVVTGLSGNARGSDIQIDGMLRNFLSWMLLKNESLAVEAQVTSNNLLLDDLLASSGAEKSTGNYQMAFPDNIQCNIQAKIGTLKFDRFQATKLKGIVTLRDKILATKSLELETMGGRFTFSGEINGQQKDRFFAECTSNMQQIDLQQLFFQCRDFGQDFIQDRHVKGKTNAITELAFVLDNQLNILPETILGNIDMIVDNGELNNFETFGHLTDYMRSNPLLRSVVRIDDMEKEMKNVRFSRLTNHIEIRNKTVTMPRVEIATNVMTLYTSATHTFDQKIDYRFDFRLKDIMVQKQPKEDFGPIADDGTGMRIFLAMVGTVDKFDIKLDKEGAKDKRKNDLIAEKQEFKSILKEEFGLFKKDTTLGRTAVNVEPAPEFLIEWTEFEDTTTSPNNDDPPLREIEKEKDPYKKPPKKNNNPKLKKFLDRLGSEEPKENSLIIAKDPE